MANGSAPRDDLLASVARFDLLAVYLFGSRANDGLAVLQGVPVAGRGSDLDVGVLFADRRPDALAMGALQVALSDIFAPLRVDLVPLDAVDPLFRFRAIDGHRIAVSDPSRADRYELGVMREAAELLPVQRRLELERFGVVTS